MVTRAGASAWYDYDAAGNITRITRVGAVSSGIIGFSPQRGKIGALVTIVGRGFAPTTAANHVSFNGEAATVVTATASRIVATVPTGAKAGPIEVRTSSATYTSATSFSLPPSDPTIISFVPKVVDPDGKVTVKGSNFRTDVLENAFAVNGLIGVVQSATPRALTATVARDATSGRFTVTTPYGTATSAGPLFVPPAGFKAADVGATGTLTVGGSTPVRLPTSERIGLVAFTGVANQRVALDVSGSTYDYAYVTLKKPDGGTLWSTSFSAGRNAWSDVLTLPAPGTYTIVVDPSDKATGSLTLGLASVPADLMQTISVGGTSSVATSTAGQDAIVAFTGVANQRVALDVSGSTYDYAYVTLKKPDGGTLWSTSSPLAATRGRTC